jgi:hypothetical protein
VARFTNQEKKGLPKDESKESRLLGKIVNAAVPNRGQ